jgi:hypothetical protein
MVVDLDDQRNDIAVMVLTGVVAVRSSAFE